MNVIKIRFEIADKFCNCFNQSMEAIDDAISDRKLVQTLDEF